MGTRAQFNNARMTNGNFLRKKEKQVLGLAKVLQFVLRKVCVLITLKHLLLDEYSSILVISSVFGKEIIYKTSNFNVKVGAGFRL